MGSPITILGSTHIWPTTGDTGYSAEALQIIQLLTAAVKPIEGLYNPNAVPPVGNIGIDDDGNLTINGTPVAAGTVNSVAIASPTDLTVSGSPITSSGTITLNLTTTGVIPGSYTLSNITVDSKGRITSISSGTPPATGVTQIIAGTNVTISPPGGTGNVTINASSSGSVSNVSATGNNGVLTNVTNPTTTPNITIGLGDITPNSVVTTSVTTTNLSSGSATITNNLNVGGTITAFGNITGQNISGTNSGDQIITATGDATGESTGAPVTTLPLTLSDTGVIAGPYTNSNITVDSKGRIIAASNGSTSATVWGSITGDIANQADLTNIFTALGNSVLSTGVTNSGDTIGLIALNDTTLRLKFVNQAIFYPLISTGINHALRSFSQIDYPLSNLTLPGDGIYIRFVGVNEAGTVITSAATFALDESTLQYGYIIVKQVAGVKTFLDGAAGPRNAFTWPSFAGDNAAINEFLVPESNIAVTPNANLTVKNSSGVIKGLGINWGTANVNERAVLSSATTSFITVNPSTALTTTLPAPGTAVQVTQFWNGAAMQTLAAAGSGSVQRFLITIAGTIYLQVGEAQYTNLQDAVDSISIAPFTQFLPPDTYIELARFASRRGATVLSNNADAVFTTGAGSVGGGSGAGTVTSVAISPTQGVTVSGSPITSSGTITVGLGDITPTTVSTGNTTVNGNLTIAGTGLSRRIISDFSTAGGARTLLQTSTVNGATNLGLIPDGTGTQGAITLYNSSDVANASTLYMQSNATNTRIGSGTTGTGIVRDLQILGGVGGAQVGFILGANNNISLGVSAALATNSTTGHVYIPSTSGIPTGIPTGSNSRVPLTFDTTNNKFYFYTNGAWHSPSDTATWGSITGDINTQADLQAALAEKVSTTGDTITGELNFSDNAVDPTTGSIIIAPPDIASSPELQVYGGDWNTTFDDSIPNAGVRLGGSYIALESTDISMQLNSAQVGSRVIVVGLSERGNAFLGVEPPPVPDYVVQATGTTDTLIYDTGPIPSAWVPITDTLTTTQDIDANAATVYFEVVVENIGNNKTGTVEIGVGINGADPIAINSVAYAMGSFVKQIYANSAINANFLPSGTTSRLYARATTGSSSGFDIFARNAERPSLLKVSVLGSGGGSATSISGLLDATTDHTVSLGTFQQTWESEYGGTEGALTIKDIGAVGTGALLNLQVGSGGSTKSFLINEVSNPDRVHLSVDPFGLVEIGRGTGGVDPNFGRLAVLSGGHFRLNQDDTGFTITEDDHGNFFNIGFRGQWSLNGDLGGPGQVLTSQGSSAPPIWTTVSGGGGTPAGNNTEIQFNNLGAFGASPSLNWNGSTLTVDGNLTIAGALRKITSNFSGVLSGGVLQRTVIQSSNVNGGTTFTVIPNGTNVNGGFTAENTSGDLTNSFYASLSATNTQVTVSSNSRGTGFSAPIYVSANNLSGVVVDQSGNVVLGGSAGALATTATTRFAYLNSMAGIPTGTPATPVQNAAATPFSGKSAITVDTTTGHLWTYGNGAWHDPTIVEQNSQTADYTTVAADAGKHILHPSADATARQFIIAANSAVPYPIGTTLMFVNQNGGGTITITINTDTMRLAGPGTTGPRTLTANGIATALKISTNEWIINGTNLT